jgi:hypothetical protein
MAQLTGDEIQNLKGATNSVSTSRLIDFSLLPRKVALNPVKPISNDLVDSDCMQILINAIPNGSIQAHRVQAIYTINALHLSIAA